MDDNKKSTTIWLRPSVISRMDGWLEADNCQSRSEFVDKALRFYMGYLGTEDNTTYISRAILTAIRGTLDYNNKRLCRREIPVAEPFFCVVFNDTIIHRDMLEIGFPSMRLR